MNTNNPNYIFLDMGIIDLEKKYFNIIYNPNQQTPKANETELISAKELDPLAEQEFLNEKTFLICKIAEEIIYIPGDENGDVALNHIVRFNANKITNITIGEYEEKKSYMLLTIWHHEKKILVTKIGDDDILNNNRLESIMGFISEFPNEGTENINRELKTKVRKINRTSNILTGYLGAGVFLLISAIAYLSGNVIMAQMSLVILAIYCFIAIIISFITNLFLKNKIKKENVMDGKIECIKKIMNDFIKGDGIYFIIKNNIQTDKTTENRAIIYRENFAIGKNNEEIIIVSCDSNGEIIENETLIFNKNEITKIETTPITEKSINVSIYASEKKYIEIVLNKHNCNDIENMKKIISFVQKYPNLGEKHLIKFTDMLIRNKFITETIKKLVAILLIIALFLLSAS